MKTAIFLFVATGSLAFAGDYSWRLSQQKAVGLAVESLKPAGYDVCRYHVADVKRSSKSHEWLISFDPPSPLPVHGDLLVVVDDKTRKIRIIDPGKL